MPRSTTRAPGIGGAHARHTASATKRGVNAESADTALRPIRAPATTSSPARATAISFHPGAGHPGEDAHAHKTVGEYDKPTPCISSKRGNGISPRAQAASAGVYPSHSPSWYISSRVASGSLCPAPANAAHAVATAPQAAHVAPRP